MRVNPGNTELQVLDYIVRPIVEIQEHPDFDLEMLIAVGKLSRMTRYDFSQHVNVVECFEKLNYGQRTKLRDFWQDSFENIPPRW